ncbi:hypothetical protein HY797_03560 [Candidatus Falkowbacteria bacterium]|nr:hypothetical protein [Candidatus Falkowbacteria bacterium]
MKKILILSLFITIFLLSGCAKIETQIVKPAEKIKEQPRDGQPLVENDNTTDSSIENNIFKLDKIKIGDVVAGMKVKSIKPFDKSFAEGAISAYNVKINFEGEAMASGKYEITKGEVFKGHACFYPSEKDQLLFPKIEGDSPITSFCFDNQDFAIKSLGTTDSGTTIVFDNYTINLYPSDVWNTAELVKVIKNIK